MAECYWPHLLHGLNNIVPADVCNSISSSYFDKITPLLYVKELELTFTMLASYVALQYVTVLDGIVDSVAIMLMAVQQSWPHDRVT